MDFHCSNCGYLAQIPDRYQGKTVKCPKCKETVLVGGEEPMPDAPQGPPGGLHPPAGVGPPMSQRTPPSGPLPRSVPTYLVQAILVTLLCCLPFGVVAIVYAAQVNSKLGVGDFDGAEEASRKAKKWCWISLGVGLAFMVIYVVLMLLGIAANIMQ